MENRLLLLGLLKAQERHGYQLMDHVGRNLAHVTSLKKATAYYELKRLEQDGLVSVRQEQDEGRPPRRVYALTAAGEEAFLDLLRESLRLADPANGGDVGLMFLDWLPKAEVLQLLSERLQGLHGALQEVRETPSHGGRSTVNLALSHAAARLEMEIRWFEDLIGQWGLTEEGPR